LLFPESVYKFMFAALSEAEYALEKDEVPIGAVVVNKNKIIGKGHNQVETLNDPTAHAEMLAITAASNHLNSKVLADCELYVSVEPCVMCSGAIILAKIPILYFGAFEPKFGACGSVYNMPQDKKLNHTVEVFSGIYSEESKNLLKTFFDKKRKIN
jgi:tRNA(adenine34) deaminase